MREHINASGRFQSDKYPTCPPGKVPLSTQDQSAQDLLWEYAQRRRVVDAEFSQDLETCLRSDGYSPPEDVEPTTKLPALERKTRAQIGVLVGEHRPELIDSLFALIELGQPHLGCASTAELLTELQTRAEMHGYGDYRTIDENTAIRALEGEAASRQTKTTRDAP